VSHGEDAVIRVPAGLFDEDGQIFHLLDGDLRCAEVPPAVGAGDDNRSRPGGFNRGPRTAGVVVRIVADLELEPLNAGLSPTGHEFGHLFG
jgi:hypothetical protein